MPGVTVTQGYNRCALYLSWPEGYRQGSVRMVFDEFKRLFRPVKRKHVGEQRPQLNRSESRHLQTSLYQITGFLRLFPSHH